MKHTIQGKEVNIHWEQGELVEKHDSGCAYYLVLGTDDSFNEYTGLGNYQSGELEDVTEIEKTLSIYKPINEKCISIEVPNGSFNHKVIDMTFVCKHNDYDESHTMVKLPSSGFKFLSLSKDMTEEQAKLIMPCKWFTVGVFRNSVRSYYDYIKKDYRCVHALESLRSWEQANGYVTVNPYPKPTCDCETEYDREGCEEKCWQYVNAQQQVVNIAYLIKG